MLRIFAVGGLVAWADDLKIDGSDDLVLGMAGTAAWHYGIHTCFNHLLSCGDDFRELPYCTSEFLLDIADTELVSRIDLVTARVSLGACLTIVLGSL